MKTRVIIISIIVMLFCISCTPAVIVEIENISEGPIEIQLRIKDEFFIDIKGAEQKVHKILNSGEIMEVNCRWVNNTLSFAESDKISSYISLFDYFSITFLNRNKTISMNDEDYFNIARRKEGVSSFYFTVQIVDLEDEASKK